jgi:hypothetical protein
MLLDESAVLSDPALWPTQKAFDQLGGSGRLKVGNKRGRSAGCFLESGLQPSSDALGIT